MTESPRHLAQHRKTRHLVGEHVVERGVEFFYRHPVLSLGLLFWLVFSIWAQLTGWPNERDRPDPGGAVFMACYAVPETCPPTTASF
jgi:hypothetical protein